jgi:N-acetylmuramic acid 6-phosphate etherase
MNDIDILHSLPTERTDPRSQRLDTLSTLELVTLMNEFDREAAAAVKLAIPDITLAIDAIAERFRAGGRLFYIGAGTSGRLGVLDASECPPTFGAPPELFQGIIAGGDSALRSAVEGAEDDAAAARRDLEERGFSARDVLVAISASGYAPYCIGGLRWARGIGALTISMACNTNALMSKEADIAIEAPTGSEILSGSTRLKAGTATKMMLNMLSTGVMVKMGKVYGNLMVDVRATNAKLRDRAARIVMASAGLTKEDADALLAVCGQSPKVSIVVHKTGKPPEMCQAALDACGGFISRAVELLEDENKTNINL